MGPDFALLLLTIIFDVCLDSSYLDYAYLRFYYNYFMSLTLLCDFKMPLFTAFCYIEVYIDYFDLITFREVVLRGFYNCSRFI